MSIQSINQYYKEFENIIDYGGSKKETAIRFAFQKLLDSYASAKGLILIAELTIKSPTGKNITPDGTLKDSLRLDWGYWESKDEADDINLEIDKKFAKGYPKENILFEDSRTAVLYQNGYEVARVDMKNSDELDKILKQFINYERPEVANFRKAIELFKNDVPKVVVALRNLISEQFKDNGMSSEGRGIRGKEDGMNSEESWIRKYSVNDEIIFINNKENFDGKGDNQNISRLENVAGSDETRNNDLSNDKEFSERGNLWVDSTGEASSGINSIEHSRRASEEQHEGIHPLSGNSERFISRSRNSNDDSRTVKLSGNRNFESNYGVNEKSREYAGSLDESIRKKDSLNKSLITTHETRPNYESLFQQKCKEFLETCKQSINPEITQEDINEMMIQHILTADIFNTIFDEPHFHRENNIAQQLETVINTFFTRQIREDLLSNINQYYQAINATAAGIADHHEKQKFLKIVYETFYKSYNPKAADRLGVVYTPNEIVKFMIESTDYLLYKHFGRFLSDKNVEILDPATGTGTFICDIIDYIPKDKLEYKYKNEIHANEVAILPYYIANLNIEFTYKQRIGKYAEFNNLCFVDTLDNMGFDYANKQNALFGLSAENTERIKRQNERKISVIIGNPPYNANQQNENDNNKNREYPIIDKRIKETYIKNSTAQKTKLYDMYSRFYRWSMDRIGEEGIIAFITNNSFINSRTFDGFRKSVYEDFDYAYIIDLGGNIRELSGKDGIFLNERHTIFGVSAAVGIAMMFLVKTNKNNKCVINYIHPTDIRATRDEKLDFIKTNKIQNINFEHIIPDKNNNWLDLTDNDWDTMILVCSKNNKENSIFKLASNGVSTNRDEWAYDLSFDTLKNKVSYFLEDFNYEVDRWMQYKIENNYVDTGNEHNPIVDNFVAERNLIKWSRLIKIDKLRKQKKEILDIDFIVKGAYRPFSKQFIFFGYTLIDAKAQFEEIIPKGIKQNQLISISTFSDTFACLGTSCVTGLDFLTKTKCLPIYKYTESGERIDNITDWGLQQFQSNYNDTNISKEDIFHYVYGVLHNPEYRKKYEMNLKREFPRIPFYEDFWKWSEWGKKLMDLHINFETVEPTQLQITNYELQNEPYKPKLKVNKDTGEIYLDNITTLSGIPSEVWDYKLGNRSALEWILDQYKEKKPKDPTIAKLFNTYKFIDYKDKVIDLLMRVTTVSVETMKIIKEMENE